MLRQAITRSVRSATHARTFSVSTQTMAAGDTGGVRSGGAAQGDAFSKREKASEDMAIRQREHEKLLEMKKKLSDQHESLKTLEKSIKDLEKEQGGKP